MNMQTYKKKQFTKNKPYENSTICKLTRVGYFLRSLGDRCIHGAVYSHDLVNLTSLFWLRCTTREKLGIYDIHDKRTN